ncbi:hypothetical protein GCM10028807_18450 [Spirosoma daeguense]
MGLAITRSLGIPTGGVAPRDYLTKNGPDERLQDYGLSERTSSKYPPERELISSNPMIFGNVTGGMKLTLDICVHGKKPI